MRYRQKYQIALDDRLSSEFGPLICGADLRRLLGFRTQAALAQARRRGTLDLAVFRIPGRRGLFALTQDVAHWLERQRTAAYRIEFGARIGGGLQHNCARTV